MKNERKVIIRLLESENLSNTRLVEYFADRIRRQGVNNANY